MKKGLDWYVILIVLFLVGLGILTLYSITFNWTNPLWKKQLLWAMVGIAGLFGASLIKDSILKRYGLPIYITSIILLIAVLFMPPIRSAHSWFVFGFFSFQPSELAKLSTIIMLSLYLKDKENRLSSFSSFLFPLIIVIIPVFLILLQPDIGSSFIFFPILLAMLYILQPDRVIFLSLVIFFLSFILSLVFFSYLFFKGYSLKFIFGYLSIISFLFFTISFIYKKKSQRLYLFSLVVILSLVSSMFASKILKDYQRKRLLVFLDQSFDPFGAGYNITQSKIAIGGGGIFGMGFLKGSQAHLGFLPEKASDFIFSVYAEEWGFVGSFILLFLFLFLTTRGISIAKTSVSPFASLLAVGISTMIVVSSFINIGICCGILPVTGIPLPFISYGGSSLLCNMTSVGILLSIKRWAR